MKSAQITRYGNTSEVIEIRQTSTPNLSAGKVLVEVKAAGINPIDWKIREGYMQQMIRLQFPSTLGLDFSGVIKQVGEDVSSDFSQVTRYTDRLEFLVAVQEHSQRWL